MFVSVFDSIRHNGSLLNQLGRQLIRAPLLWSPKELASNGQIKNVGPKSYSSIASDLRNKTNAAGTFVDASPPTRWLVAQKIQGPPVASNEFRHASRAEPITGKVSSRGLSVLEFPNGCRALRKRSAHLLHKGGKTLRLDILIINQDETDLACKVVGKRDEPAPQLKVEANEEKVKPLPIHSLCCTATRLPI